MSDASSVDLSPSPEAEPLSVAQAIANLQGDDLGLRMYAAWWLGRFQVGGAEAVDALILGLFDEDDRTEAGGYPLRRNAARALGKLGDLRAVPALIRCLECSDYYVREAAVQALEQLGDISCAPHLQRLLQPELEESKSAHLDSDLAQPFDAILEALGTLQVVSAIPIIQSFLEHPVERVRCSAIRAMYQLTGDAEYGDRLVSYLASPLLQLRRTVLGDLGKIGYVPAAEAIAQTHAENSLKLIALKGLLESEINLETQLQLSIPERLSAESIHIMELMDDLL